jgi:alkylation response protein AidB-like acyl-CoA dehydrogenase
MSLALNEDQELLQDSAKNFVAQNAPLTVLRQLRDTSDDRGFDEKIWAHMIELGWAGIAIEESFGGFNFGHVGLGVVLEETGRTLVSSPLVSSVLLGATAISYFGSDVQKNHLLLKVVKGQLLLALAVDELPIHSPNHIESSATKVDGGYKLNGAKTFVLDGHVADKLIVVVRVVKDGVRSQGLSLFVVDKKASGLNIQRTSMVDCRNCANLTFTDVHVDEENRLGADIDIEDSTSKFARVLDIGRIGVASEMLGSMQAAFDLTLTYLKQREQFGVLIGSFQGLQHRAAAMYSEIELCRSAVRGALFELDNMESSDDSVARIASMTKAKVSDVAQLVSNEAIQMHGGIGMTDEYDVGFYIKRARVAQQFLGDAPFHRDRYASLNSF